MQPKEVQQDGGEAADPRCYRTSPLFPRTGQPSRPTILSCSWDLGEAWPAQGGVSSSGRDSQSVTVLQLEAREWVLMASTQTIKTSFTCAN